MVRSSIILLISFSLLAVSSKVHSGLEKKDFSPIKTSLKALRTVNEVKDIQKRFKNKLENKVKNAVGNVFSDVFAKRLSGAAVMLITQEVKVRYKDFRLTLDNEELVLTYGKGF